MFSQNFCFIFLIDALRLILGHSGWTSSQFSKGSLHSQSQLYLVKDRVWGGGGEGGREGGLTSLWV